MIHRWNAGKAASLCIADLPTFLVREPYIAPAYTITFFHDLAGYGVLTVLGYREGDSTSTAIPAHLITDFVFVPGLPDDDAWSAVPANNGTDFRAQIYENLWFLAKQLLPLATLFRQALASDLKAALETCDGNEAEAIHLFASNRLVAYAPPDFRAHHLTQLTDSRTQGLNSTDAKTVHMVFEWAVQQGQVSSVKVKDGLPEPAQSVKPVSASEAKNWYETRVKQHPIDSNPPSREADYQAGIDFFGKLSNGNARLSMGRIKQLRSEHAPDHWKSQGRRKSS
jgi:hypothetical protein